MCTAATYKTNDFYFGRTLDYEFSYGDEVTVTPRNYSFKFRHSESLESHFAIIGMAFVTDDYPLYYDAFNEKGLCMAGLNFVGNAVYGKPVSDCTGLGYNDMFTIVVTSFDGKAMVKLNFALIRTVTGITLDKEVIEF